jgi:hypothetical protein
MRGFLRKSKRWQDFHLGVLLEQDGQEDEARRI